MGNRITLKMTLLKLSPSRLVFILILITVCFSCKQTKNERNGKLKIVTTTGMIYDAVLNIGGSEIEVQALMGPGVDPHLYKATQGDISKLQNADLIVYNGLHLEGKMGDVFEKLSRQKPVHAITEGLPSSLFRESETYKDTFDPHIWFDVSLWKKAVQNIATTLINLDSANRDLYKKNAFKYMDQLDSLHISVKSSILEIPEEQRLLITAHDAFGYFGDAYQIEVNGLQGISTLSEPGLKDISQLVNLIVDRKIKSVFIETSVSKKAINAVVEGCSQRGHQVSIGGSLYSDAMGPFGEFEGTYIGMVHKNVQTIVNALK
ncbi:MAG: zinc ABC transporter substrate-binding protein [Reichenbachiella sp.]